MVALIQTPLPPSDTVDVEESVEARHATEYSPVEPPQPLHSNPAAWAGPVITRRVLELAKKLGIPPEALL